MTKMSEAQRRDLQKLADAGGSIGIHAVDMARELCDIGLAFPMMDRHGYWLRISAAGRRALSEGGEDGVD